MFSVSISVVLLVFFVSQALGQTSSTVSLNVSPSPSSAVVSSSSVSNLATTTSSTTPTEPTTKTSEEPTTPSDKTCAKLSVVIDKPWNDNYKNNASDNFQNLSDAFSFALKELFNDPKKYTNVEVSEVQFTEEKGKVLASAKLCLVFKGGVEVFIEDVFKRQVATGKLDTDLPVKKDSAEFERLGVSFNKDWTAKEGECEKKCEGTAGPFLVVRECEPETGFSCDGLKEPTEETRECTKYCSSTVAVSVSFVILMVGIFLSSSFQ